MIAAAERAGVTFMVGHSRRFTRRYREVRAAIDSGAIAFGAVRLVRENERRPRAMYSSLKLASDYWSPTGKPWISVAGYTLGAPMTNAVHETDLLRWFAGSEAASVQAESRISDPEGEVSDYISITIRFPERRDWRDRGRQSPAARLSLLSPTGSARQRRPDPRDRSDDGDADRLPRRGPAPADQLRDAAAHRRRLRGRTARTHRRDPRPAPGSGCRPRRRARRWRSPSPPSARPRKDARWRCEGGLPGCRAACYRLSAISRLVLFGAATRQLLPSPSQAGHPPQWVGSPPQRRGRG